MEKIEITISQELTPQDINDIVSTALEGGINYWCGGAIIKDVPAKAEGKYDFASDVISVGGTLELYDAESPDRWELNLEKLLNGIKMHCTKIGKTPLELMDDYDACDADCIVQYAVMGEIVFG
jgi:hypothetical protein